jgi:hypothetical protein
MSTERPSADIFAMLPSEWLPVSPVRASTHISRSRRLRLPKDLRKLDSTVR